MRRSRRWRRSTWGSLLLAAGLVVLALLVQRLVPPLTGEVRVADGDSLEIDGTRVRIEGIDAPELHQSCGEAGARWPCGLRARAALEAVIGEALAQQGGAVTCRPVDEDRYGRSVAVCEAGERDIGAVLVGQGWAVATGLSYAGEERAARAARAGIWAGPFEMPADWRGRHPRPPN
ncbi:thermonuclease family protein [Ancylobacter pratisalsi]|uniref:Thermonuclease family protein n=1 Tax=Ancylobacter pratisalsi TaxID=1745854 RepID=A0A6P1YJJ1_9HYPH|nr:thermonuclease family protein [Ancylobacter pratisalsi]QIB32876.1 thermonuclease family protein [Ancylobacter pratisalsi]